MLNSVHAYNGKASIANLPLPDEGGAAALGLISAVGIEIYDHPSEIQRQYFTDSYKTMLDNGIYDTITYYELGRNFWAPYMEKIAFGPKVRTGYAVAMRYFSMKAGDLGLKDGGAYFKNLARMVDYYAADPSQAWDNTLAVWQPQANNPAYLDATGLYTSFLIRLHKLYGGQEFLTRFWQEVAKRPDAKSPNDAVDNFFVAASMAAKRNLTTLFSQKWRWPISPSAQAEVSIYPAG